MKRKYLMVISAVVFTAGLWLAGRVTAGIQGPMKEPEPTMNTLEKVYPAQVDSSPAAGNINTNVAAGGIVGTFSTNAGGGAYSAIVLKTGQTNSYRAGDDGNFRKGVVWTGPRFAVLADTNCVRDSLTGLIWARNANIGGSMTWSNAIVYCESLDYGGQSDWRLPNVRELQSLTDFGRYGPVLPLGHPFTGVQSGDSADYWSSTTYAEKRDFAWYICLYCDAVLYCNKSLACYVWPVRGEQ